MSVNVRPHYYHRVRQVRIQAHSLTRWFDAASVSGDCNKDPGSYEETAAAASSAASRVGSSLLRVGGEQVDR